MNPLRDSYDLIIMLDPLTALGLASAVVQLADFGIKTLKGSIQLYYAANGIDSERSDLDLKIQGIRDIAGRVKLLHQQDKAGGSIQSNGKDLQSHAKSCDDVASDLLSVLEDFKVKEPAGLSRRWESFEKAASSLTPWNKEKVGSLVKRLDDVKERMFQHLHIMMR